MTRLPYRTAATVWPHAEPSWPGVMGSRSFRWPYNTGRTIAAATLPTWVRRYRPHWVARLAIAVAWHTWAVTVLAATIITLAVTVTIHGLVLGARWLLGHRRTASDVDPIEVEAFALLQASRAGRPLGGPPDVGGQSPAHAPVEPVTEPVDPADRVAWDRAQRARELDRIEADRIEHHRLLDRIETINQHPTSSPPPADGGADSVRRMICVALPLAAAGYALVLFGFVAWASNRLDQPPAPAAVTVEMTP